MSAVRFVPHADVICDIGGQDIKVLFLAEAKDGTRDVKDFRLSNQCSAGNGMLLQAMADQFGVHLHDYADTAFGADLSPKFSYGCAVFLDADRVNFQKEGFTAQEMLSGLAKVLPKNVWQYVAQVPRLAEFGRVFVLQGGTQRNLAAVKAQVDYIEERVPDAEVVVHPHTGEAGAIGAAMETLRVVKREARPPSSVSTRPLRSTTPPATTSRRSATSAPTSAAEPSSTPRPPTVAPAATSRASPVRRARWSEGSPEGARQGAQRHPEAVPEPRRRREPTRVQALLRARAAAQVGRLEKDVRVRARCSSAWPGAWSTGASRSYADLSNVKIGMPRVMNLYTAAPFFRTYFETLGLPKPRNIIWSPPTTEEMWVEGGRYGSIDPCYPSKVIQAHLHELVFHAHTDEKRKRAARLHLLPVHHAHAVVPEQPSTPSCPIVAGSPLVTKASFTKEVDFFAREGIEYIDDAVASTSPTCSRSACSPPGSPRLGITEDESDWAVDQGFEALRRFDEIQEEKGKAIIEQMEREDRVAILVIGRPYHSDPGLNHGIPDEFQVLGYPVLSIRSIPKDPVWLKRRMRGLADPLDLNDVWPENFSTNSVQKVWAARFAAFTPTSRCSILSSFKCGHDAPTYGIITASS